MSLNYARRTSCRAHGTTSLVLYGAVVLAAAALTLLLSGCLTTGAVLQVTVDGHSPQYVRGQIIDAMSAAGYKKVSFSNFETDGDLVREIRSAGADEYRFQRTGDTAYVARVFYDKPREITVRLNNKVQAGSGDAVRIELARIKDALRAEFGEIVVLR